HAWMRSLARSEIPLEGLLYGTNVVSIPGLVKCQKSQVWRPWGRIEVQLSGLSACQGRKLGKLLHGERASHGNSEEIFNGQRDGGKIARSVVGNVLVQKRNDRKGALGSEQQSVIVV